MAKEPGERYATAGQLAEDLRRFLADRPILARRSSAIERSWRWSKRNPLVAGAVGAVAAALVAVAVISVLYADRAGTQANQGNHPSQCRPRQGTRSSTTSLAESNRLLAIRNFDRGQAAFEKGEIGPGLLWMVESWRSAVEAGDPVWQHAARANLAAWRPHHARLKGVLSHESPVDAAAFSPDGKTVLTGGDDSTARLWDAATGQPIGQPIRHEGVVTSVAFSPDGKTILTGSTDKTARLWDAATGQPVGSPFPHGGEVMAVAYSPDGKTILTGSQDKMARLWDAATHRPIGQPFVHQDTVSIGGVQSRRQVPPHRERRRDGAALGRRHRPAHRLAPATSRMWSMPWRSAPTASPSSPGATTARCSGGTRRPGNPSASPSGID